MMRKVLPMILLVLGVLIVFISLGADRLGIGGAPGVGWKQISGAVLGVILAATGMVLSKKG
jgi:hypothetical protein